jgi:hypothetical protein
MIISQQLHAVVTERSTRFGALKVGGSLIVQLDHQLAVAA